MRIFNCKHRYQEETTGEGDAGSATNSDTSTGKQEQVDDFSDVWHNGSSDQGNQGVQEPQRVTITNQPDVKELTPQEKLSAHIESLNLADGFDMNAMQNPETAVKEMQRMQANTYAAAMKDTNTLIQQAVGQVREELQQDAREVVSGNQTVNAMNTALPYTKKPAYKPVSDSLLTQFQAKGQTPEEAILSVGKYFTKMAGDVNANLPKVPNNRLNGNNFNGNTTNQNQTDDADSQDWMNFLTAK